jgi:hypothetical protein
MALREMERLGEQAHHDFEIAHIGIVHRTGRLEIGETSVVISVSAPHRSAAFAACEWAIHELKRTVPIWKKEVFEDGEAWVEGERNQFTDYADFADKKEFRAGLRFQIPFIRVIRDQFLLRTLRLQMPVDRIA